MRASKNEENREKHISGAEGIYEYGKIHRAVKKLLERAVKHPKGVPDKIVITVEKIIEEIQIVSALSISTFFSKSSEEASNFIKEKLKSLGISEKALNKAFHVIKNYSMRGATLIDYASGERLEPDKTRGVRVSRIQMQESKRSQIIKEIKKISTDPQRVIEALTIASKVLSCPEIIAELCISDNPDYTTGYIASKEFGYLRITNIKSKGETIGGRAFFIKTPSNIGNLIEYLERKPVLVV